MNKNLTKLNPSSDDNESFSSRTSEASDSSMDRANVISVIFLVVCGAVFILAAWFDTSSRFEELESRIALHKTEIYYFIPIGSAFLLFCLLVAKRWGGVTMSFTFHVRVSWAKLLPICIFIILFVGLVIGGVTSSEQNTHRWATNSNGPTELKEIAAASPQKFARLDWLTYMKLSEFLDGKTVVVGGELDPQYLNGFSNANVKVDYDFDSVAVPYGRMAAMEILLEGPIYEDRRLLLFGEGETYRFFSTPKTYYVVAD